MLPKTFIYQNTINVKVAQFCKGICERKKALSRPNNLRYKSGQKRCGNCDCYFDTTEITCPCCTTRLRTKPRNKRKLEQ